MATEPKLTAREKRWRAEDDARTLANAQVINDDPGRHVLAKRAAQRIAKQEKESADAMQGVATGKKVTPTKATKKTTRAKATGKPKQPGFNVFGKI